MARVRLFAQAREAAGTAEAMVQGATVAEVIARAEQLWGPHFAAVVARSKVWCNGEEVRADHPVGDNDEVAVLPPVSGGA